MTFKKKFQLTMLAIGGDAKTFGASSHSILRPCVESLNQRLNQDRRHDLLLLRSIQIVDADPKAKEVISPPAAWRCVVGGAAAQVSANER